MSERSHRPCIFLLIVAAAMAAAAVPQPQAARAGDDAVVAALRGGGVAVLLRHTRTTPGVGDPPGWTSEDCSSQRNLDAGGREHARRIGAWFRRQRITPTEVRNSAWCRTRDTARLAFGRTRDWPALANLFEDRAPEKANVEQVRRYIAGLRRGDVAVLVSHGSSINAFVGEYLSQGEAVVVRARRGSGGEVEVDIVGRIAVP